MRIAVLLRLLSAFLVIIGLSCCTNTKKIAYFNNVGDTTINDKIDTLGSTIRAGDLISITVSSLNPEATLIFNVPNLAPAVNTNTSSSSLGGGGSAAPQIMGYLVSPVGTIKFPVIGEIAVGGMNKRDVEKLISDSLREKKLLVDPLVSVRFLNFRVTVLGEVARPTTISVSNERITLLEALGLAGDLTIYGKRENVLLIRQNGSTKTIKRLDLNSSSFFSSPYYFLQTNDIIYVEPNSAKIASTSRTQQLLPIILSALSFVAIIVTYTLKK